MVSGPVTFMLVEFRDWIDLRPYYYVGDIIQIICELVKTVRYA